jgi:hypothetical protein
MIRLRALQLSTLPVVLLAVAACGTAAMDGSGSGAVPSASADPDLEIAVEVDVMSGVPNPAWTVSGSEAAHLAELLHGLPDTGKGDVTSAMQLGFRGFVLRGDGLTADADVDQVRVLGTEILATKGPKMTGRTLTDADRSVYTLLRSMAAEHLTDNIMQAIPLEGLTGST